MTDVMTPHSQPTREVRSLDAARLLPCQQEDASDLFFSERPADLEAAKDLCRTCPLQQACLDGALARHEPWGVWGGSIFAAGEIIAAKRPRGRPRKNAA